MTANDVQKDRTRFYSLKTLVLSKITDDTTREEMSDGIESQLIEEVTAGAEGLMAKKATEAGKEYEAIATAIESIEVPEGEENPDAVYAAKVNEILTSNGINITQDDYYPILSETYRSMTAFLFEEYTKSYPDEKETVTQMLSKLDQLVEEIKDTPYDLQIEETDDSQNQQQI